VSAFRFVFMTDCQLGCYASFSGMTAEQVQSYSARDMRVEVAPPTTGWAWDQDRLRAAIAATNGIDPAFVVVGGDMVDDPSSEGQLEALREEFAALRSPVHWVAGNHDCSPDAQAPTPASLRDYRVRFGTDHWAFTHNGVACIALNSVVLSHPDSVPGELAAQMSFLEQSLEVARTDGARFILLFGHHPLFTADPDEPDTYWNVPRAQREDVLRLCAAFGVRAYFCGHWHRNARAHAGRLEVVVTGPVGYPLGEDPSGLRVVDVDELGVSHHYVALPEMADVGGE
jgi:serine/threonine-protein phosphatase CPPED1